MAKTYTLTATSINGGRHSSYESDWRNYSANENKDAGRRNDDYKATNILFNATTLASLRSKPILSIKLKLTITNGTIYTSGSYARQLIGYKLNSTTTTSSAGSAWTRSDANSTAASGTVYAGQILAATETTITSPTVVTFDLTGSSVPVYGYVIGPSRSSLSSYSYITISAATLEVITNEYDITYNANGGSGAPAAQVKTHGTALTLSSTIPTRNSTSTSYTVTYNAHGGSVSPASATASRVTSYGFSHWNTKSDGTGTSYSAGGSYTANASTTLYAQWESSTPIPIVTLPTPTWEGRTFNGWYTAASGGTRVGGGGDVYTPSANVTLHAQWTLKTYTVSYNANGGTGAPSTQHKTHGVDLTLSSLTPTRANESAGSYTVRFNANGGTVTPSSATSALTQSFTFWKWNTKADGTGTNYASHASYTDDANVTLYARWTYNSPTAAAVTLPTPTRSGYLFNGWYTATSGGIRVGGGGSSYVPTIDNTNLYAQWSAQKSTVSTTNGTLGTAQTITITRNNSSFKHTLTYSYGSATGTIATKTTSVSVSWTPPTSLASAFPSATSGTCTITCETFDGNTSLGTTTTTCSLAIPASIKPTISSFTATPQSSNTAISGWGVLVKGYSTAKLTVAYSLTNAGGAELASIAFSGPGISSTGTSTTATTSTMTTTGSKTWTVIVTDSRGRTATTTVSKTVYDYANPVISSIEVCRCNSDGTLNNNSGTYIKFKPHFSVSSVNGNNGLAISNGAMLKWRVSGGSYGTAFSVTNDTWTAVQGGGAISTASTYEGQLTVTDKVGNSTTLTVTLPGSSGLWYGRGNDRLGLGSAPSGAGLYCDWNATFKGVLDVTNRRCEATIPANSAGWYRVFDYSAANADRVSGDIAFSIDITILERERQYHKITLYGIVGALKFGDEISVTNISVVDKIRYVKDGTHGYIDVHFSYSASRHLACYFDVKCNYSNIHGSFTSVTPTLTADSPVSPATVLTEYTFAADTEAVGTVVGASGFTPGEIDVKRSGRVVYVHFYVQNVSIAANTGTLIGTLSGVPLPEKGTRWLAGGGVHAYDAVTPVYAILETNGNITVRSPSAISAVNITISYIV